MERLFAAWARFLERVFPDPFTLSLWLTLAAFLVALFLTPYGLGELVGFWGHGLWGFLGFAMQMALVLVTGQALAEAPVVARSIRRLAALPKTTAQGVVLVSASAMSCAWLNWGFGLIVGAILAREVADALADKLGEQMVGRALLGAAGYTGLAFWHGGLSGSSPLTVAQPGHFLEDSIGVIPLQQTVLSTPNLVLSLVLLVLVPLFLAVMAKTGLSTHGESVAPRPEITEPPAATPGGRLLVLAVVIPALYWWFAKLNDVDLNAVIFAFLFLGLLVHGTPERYNQALGRAVSGAAGIILQFPFYAGIVGVASESGLVKIMSDAFVTASHGVDQATGFQPFLLFVFLSAGLVNLFVPSGGGQWMVQGPIVMSAAAELGVDQAATVMAVSYGDQWTNLLQPFWALPLLAITGLKPGQLISVTTPLLVWQGLIIGIAVSVF